MKLYELLKLCDQAFSTGEANQDVKYTLYFGADVLKALIQEVIACRQWCQPDSDDYFKETVTYHREKLDQILEKMR